MSNEMNPPRPEETDPALKESTVKVPEAVQKGQAKAKKNSRLLVALLPITAILLVLAVLSILKGGTLFGTIGRFFRYYGSEATFSFDANSANSYVSFHQGLAVASLGGLQCYDEDGNQIDMVQNEMDPPMALANGTSAMSFGIGGSTITTIHYRKGANPAITVPGSLVDADLSSDGCIGYSAIQPGYKSVLTALDGEGNEIYSWYSSTRFFGVCAISEKAAKFCAVAPNIEASDFDTTAVMFATDTEEPLAELSLGNDMIYDLTFIGQQRLCAVGETQVHFFDIDGKHYNVYPFGGSELCAYNLNGSGFAAIVLDTNQVGDRFRIVTLNVSGQELASISLDEEIRDISANGNYLAVLTSHSLRVYDSKLHPCYTEDNVRFASAVCVQEDGAALLIEGNTARRVS